MPLIKIRVFLPVVLLFWGSLNACQNTTPPEYRRLFNLPERQQAIEFQQYSPEEQVEIYWYAVRSVEPPATQFADFLAANRRKVLPPLLAKLRQEKNDMVKYYLMNVLSTMHTDHCTLKNDAEVIETIKSTIATVRDSRIRKLCETSLKTILEQPAAGGPC